MAPKKPPAAKGGKQGVDLAGMMAAKGVKKKIPAPPKCFNNEEILRFKQLFNETDEEGTGLLPLKHIAHMLRVIGFNPKATEVEELCKKFLEDPEFQDTFELHEWYQMIEAKKNWGDDPEFDVVKAIEFLGKDNPDAPTGIVQIETLMNELFEWGEALKPEEFVDLPKVALKEKLFNSETGELQYVKFVERMNEKDEKFNPEPVNFFKLDQATLAKMAMEKAHEERETMTRKEAERVAREEHKRQKMVEAGLLRPEDALVPIVAQIVTGPNPFDLLASGK